ncbi:MAG: nucleolar complex protein 14 [Piccolia ochrophora]|nr:MAG: nucleolar complex protein 14 [Piccolia ochrophora]
MPPSQLKQLKASLKAEGVVGPQRSKKRKRNAGPAGDDGSALHRRAALQNVRQAFSPFELHVPARGREKFQVTSGSRVDAPQGRPGVTKGRGEQARRQTLLREIQERNKVGGIRDRRFGENDPTMTPEEKLLERFAREKQRRLRNGAVFDLEGDGESNSLTHLGQSLAFDELIAADDFDEDVVASVSDEDSATNRLSVGQTRRRIDFDDGSASEAEESLSERKRSKAEVMKEVVAKSKLYKYERQQAKDEDEEERERLDKMMPDLFALMDGDVRAPALPNTPFLDESINPQKFNKTSQREDPSRDVKYDRQLREMTLDKRSRPSDRTKTDQEKTEEVSSHLRRLEDQRLRRMRGENSGYDEQQAVNFDASHSDDSAEVGDEPVFGLGQVVAKRQIDKILHVEDEDDFVIDEDLVAASSPSDHSKNDGSRNFHRGSRSTKSPEDDNAHRGSSAASRERLATPEASSEDLKEQLHQGVHTGPVRSYPCPQSHEELLEVVHDHALEELPTAVQLIRAQHPAHTHHDNKIKMATFSVVLFKHIIFLTNRDPHPPSSVLDSLLRHLHSLAKTYPLEIADAFRSHLNEIGTSRVHSPLPGDLILLTAIPVIFPASDYFHPVVTPALLTMTRYLSQTSPDAWHDLVVGAYVGTLTLRYLAMSKRFAPELLTYVLNALCNLAPTPPEGIVSAFPYRKSPAILRLTERVTGDISPLRFWDWSSQRSFVGTAMLKATLIETYITLTDAMADLWTGQVAFVESFTVVLRVLKHYADKPCYDTLSKHTQDHLSEIIYKLEGLLDDARMSRRSLTLHYHRPLAIKSSLPKFEDTYNMDMRYDPDQERASSSKLKAEHKRERKSALRELRKDANFIARESLKEKKEKDREYEKKYKRLISDIQGEEAREAKLYDSEKRRRKEER